jgi:hypothetical protein
LPDDQARCYYIPREKEQAFNQWVAPVKNGQLEQYVQNGGETFEHYTGAGGRALIRSWFKKPLVD